MYGRILVPIDGSETSLKGLAEAIRLARCLNAALRLVHVVEELGVPGGGLSGVSVVQQIEALREAGTAVLDDAVALARRAGVEVDSVLIEALGGPAGRYIVENAAQCQADLIVCGTHGRRGIRRVLMGSDAEYVVRHSNVPVLLVRNRPGSS